MCGAFRCVTLINSRSSFSIQRFAFLETHQGGTNAAHFLEIMRRCVSALPIGAVLVMDNCSIHHTHEAELRALLYAERRGVLVFLPPYSPDMSPIEPAFGLIKRKLREVPMDALRSQPAEHIVEASLSITFSQRAGWWAGKCGYRLK